jgi:hypothetical protein
MSFIKKWLKIPSGETSVEAFETYEVRWTSRFGEYHSRVKPEVEVFPSKEDAGAFATALTNAFRLIRHTGSGTIVTMKKRD